MEQKSTKVGLIFRYDSFFNIATLSGNMPVYSISSFILETIAKKASQTE
jgi:hypothetical protein